MTTDAYKFATLENYIGHQFGPSEPILITQEKINLFAEVTNDPQWIHVDVERTKRESPFGAPVAHGFLTLSIIAGAFNDLGIIPADAGGSINYGIEKLRFLAPVPVESALVATFKVKDVTMKGEGRKLMRFDVDVSAVNSAKPAIVAETLVMIFAKDQAES